MKITWALSPHPNGLYASGAGGYDTAAMSADVGDRIIERGKSFHGKTWKQLVALSRKPGYFDEEVPNPPTREKVI